MSPAMDFDTLRRAMADNYEQPEGPARNARAEQLLAEAETAEHPARGDRGARAPAEGLQLQLREGQDVRPLRAAAAHVGRAARGLRRVRDPLPALGLQVDVGGHARPAARPARLHREVARRDGAPLPARRALRTGRAQRRVQCRRHIGRPGARRAGVHRLAGRRPRRDGRLPRLRAARAGLVAGGARRGRGGAGAVGAGPGGRVHLRPRAAHRPRVLPAAAAAPGPRRRGPRPPSAGLPAGARHGEHARRVRGPRRVLRADRQRGTRPGTARGAPGVLHGLRGAAQPAGLPGGGGAR